MRGTGRRTPRLRGAGITCAQARRAARHLLSETDMGPERAGDVLTVVSELVANAHRHAGGVTGFRITPLPGAVVVEVSDASFHLPHRRPWSAVGRGGFGWLLVKRLAITVTVRCDHHGKTITALLTAEPPP
ncbi:ATP-binding protein [Streptomyces erythrochromogenes]|uniref:ATP-binding protein n=1 Tax=Streptomyces erythrochromogenes TaxID=285574 RepID=UPI0036FFB216